MNRHRVKTWGNKHKNDGLARCIIHTTLHNQTAKQMKHTWRKQWVEIEIVINDYKQTRKHLGTQRCTKIVQVHIEVKTPETYPGTDMTGTCCYWKRINCGVKTGLHRDTSHKPVAAIKCFIPNNKPNRKPEMTVYHNLWLKHTSKP